MMSQFVIGCDLGQSVDPSTIAVLKHKPYHKTIESLPGSRKMREEAIRVIHSYDLIALEKIPLGTPYPQVAERVMHYCEHPTMLGDVDLVIDATGVGRAVYDMMQAGKMSPIGVILTGGVSASYSESTTMWSLPKKDLVGALVTLYQTGRLKMNPKLPNLEEFRSQLQGFTAKLKKDSAHVSYEALTDDIHDDLVIAVALAAWWSIIGASALEEIIRLNPGKREYDPKRWNIRKGR